MAYYGDGKEPDPRFPIGTQSGLPPSPSRENPGQVFPSNDPDKLKGQEGARPLVGSGKRRTAGVVTSTAQPEGSSVEDKVTTQEGGMFTD
ncbi:hypothetical protein CC2G_002085 [Coprinopsis cinerea AmutBmut pab1-1]|nr:hypothetical protein CC2G_002085 [Coprinopsis cinerea AmutBmut pab1-1]